MIGKQRDTHSRPSARWLTFNVFTAIALGLLVAGICAGSAWSMAWLWASACLAAGAAVGFLFGIPKTEQKADAGNQSSYRQQVNTSLEQISDWLTKILVGLGLAELSKIPTMLQDAAGYVAKGLGPATGVTSLAYGLIVYFSIAGFIGGYLLTRIFLPRILFEAESGLGDQAQQGAISLA
jgi:hypothetical protein